MRNDCLKDPDINHFPATDEKEVEIGLKDLFPNKILIYAKGYLGALRKEFRIYAGSATCKIHCPLDSSFSGIASKLEIFLCKL